MKDFPVDAPGSSELGRWTDQINAAFTALASSFQEIARVVGERAGEQARAQTLADGLLCAARTASSAAGYVLEQDPAAPVLEKFISWSSRGTGMANPDCSYLHAALDGAHSYRLRGNRGTAALLEAEISTLNIGDGEQSFVCSLASEGVDLQPGEDFEIALSRTPGPGPALRLPDGPCFIIVRQYFYDWDAEQPARLILECDGTPLPPGPAEPSAMGTRVERLCRWMRQTYPAENRLKLLAREPNTLHATTFGEAFLASNLYVSGYVVLEPDCAAVVEFEAPDAAYWSIQVTDPVGNLLQPHLRQTSINGRQASIDSDGVFRAVISPTDPGVRNWLDSTGRRLLLVMIRLNGVGKAPEFSVRTVRLETLPGALPAAAPISPQARQEALRRRLAFAYRNSMIEA